MAIKLSSLHASRVLLPEISSGLISVRSRIRDPMRWMNFFNVLNLSGRTRPRGLLSVTEMSTRSRKIMFLGSRTWPVYRADSSTVSRLCKQCGILNIAQPYKHPRPVTAISLFLLISVRGWVKPRAMVRLERYVNRKTSMTILEL
jgi:hypothetical protein